MKGLAPAGGAATVTSLATHAADHLVPRDPSSLLLKIHRSCNIRRAAEMRGG